MSNHKTANLPPHAAHACLAILFVLMTGAASASAQAQPAPASTYYGRTNTYSIFSAYSGDSSHMLLGTAENRKLLEFGVAYGRKLFRNRVVNWQYHGELLPVALESDPEVQRTFYQVTPVVATYIDPPTLQANACVAASGSYSDSYTFPDGTVTYSGTEIDRCLRRWTIGEGISPIGFQWNFMPRHKLQPFLISHGGYMYSTRPIPTTYAGSFNFTFDGGAGIEVFRSKTRSICAEYRYHHISNHNTASDNPGIDNGLFQLTYSFGR
ncbi:MAG: acyloxyacyl hydrolase [Terracidiphilus sp.]